MTLAERIDRLDAYRQIRGKLDVEFEDCGDQDLKNIAYPVRVFCLRRPHSETPNPPPFLPNKALIIVAPFGEHSARKQACFANGMMDRHQSCQDRQARGRRAQFELCS